MVRGGRHLGDRPYFPTHVEDATRSARPSATAARTTTARAPRPDVARGAGARGLHRAALPQGGVPPLLVVEPRRSSKALVEALSQQTGMQRHGRSTSRASSAASGSRCACKGAEPRAWRGCWPRRARSRRARARWSMRSTSRSTTSTRLRIECFDISHTAGEATQASCVVFEDHKMQSSQYRRYNIAGITPRRRLRRDAPGAARRYGKLAEAWRRDRCAAGRRAAGRGHGAAPGTRSARCPTSCWSTAAAARSSMAREVFERARPRRSRASSASRRARARKVGLEELVFADGRDEGRARPRLGGADAGRADPRRGAPLRDHRHARAARERAHRRAASSRRSPASARRSAPSCCSASAASRGVGAASVEDLHDRRRHFARPGRGDLSCPSLNKTSRARTRRPLRRVPAWLGAGARLARPASRRAARRRARRRPRPRPQPRDAAPGRAAPPAAPRRRVATGPRCASRPPSGMVAANPDDHLHRRRCPIILLAIPVLEIELNARRQRPPHRGPARADARPRTRCQIAVDAVRRAAPFGDVSRLPRPWKFVEIFLFDDDAQVQAAHPRALIEPGRLRTPDRASRLAAQSGRCSSSCRRC